MNPVTTPERPAPPRLGAERIAELRGSVPTFSDAERSARTSQAMADINRVLLLSVLAVCGEPLCVTDLVFVVDREQSLVSHHLAVLYRAGLVQRRKRTRLTYYELTDKGADWAKTLLGAAVIA